MKHILAAALLLVASAAGADEGFKRLQGTIKGQAAVNNGDRAAARQAALDQAMRDACIQGSGATIDSATLIEGSTQLSDKIFSHANGYIKSFTASPDTPDSVSDGIYTVELSDVMVGTAELSKDVAAIKAMLASKGHPRIYTLIREQSLEEVKGTGSKDKPASVASLSQGIVEEALVSQMRPLGWKFVDPEVASGKVHVQNAVTTDLGSLNGRDFATTGADYVILGSVIVRPQEANASMKGSVFVVQLRTVLYVKSTDTGDTVASVEKTDTVPNVVSEEAAASKALEKAGGEIAEALSKQVLETWRARAMGTGDIHLLVAVADYDALNAFEEVMKNSVSGVKSVDEVSYNDGKADLSVVTAGANTKQLAGAISNKSVKGLNVKVTKVTANTLEVKLGR